MEDEEKDNETVVAVKKKQSEVVVKRRRKKKLVIPRREPSVVIPGRQIIFITPDKTTCDECVCFPKEDPYAKPKKLNPCQKSPLTLYEYAAAIVDRLVFPPAFNWTVELVTQWMSEGVGLPQYQGCIRDNNINGRRLLMLEDPSHLPAIGICSFQHIQMITSKVHQLFGTEFIRFSRSIGLPPRKPLTHCTWFKSRTGPTWGIRVNWTRCDILRWMKIIMPEPLYLDHWDLVWYHKPDFPKVKFARLKKRGSAEIVPHYDDTRAKEPCREYQVPRRFRLQGGIPEDQQMIWMERRVSEEERKKEKERKKKKVKIKPMETRVYPKPVSCEGLAGKDLLLARRKMAKPKFLANTK